MFPQPFRTIGGMRLGTSVAGVCAAAFLAAGCAGEPGVISDEKGLTSAETRWVAAWSAWSDELGFAVFEEANARVSLIESPGAYRAATRGLRMCATRLADQVGPGPTARLAALADRQRVACRLLERATTRLARAYESDDDPPAALVATAAALGRVDAIQTSIEERLAAFSLARRALPAASRPTLESHVSPVLEMAAEATIEGFETDVRCWSAREWPAVIEEEEALSNGDLTLDSTGAFVNSTALEINMQGSDCAALARAEVEGRFWPEDGDDRRRLAWALSVLAHEAQHVAGAHDEAETECRAVQRAADVALALGAPRTAARDLAELAWEDLYETLPDDYRTPLCRDGGPYDLRPGVAGNWPWG